MQRKLPSETLSLVQHSEAKNPDHLRPGLLSLRDLPSDKCWSLQEYSRALVVFPVPGPSTGGHQRRIVKATPNILA